MQRLDSSALSAQDLSAQAKILILKIIDEERKQ